MLRCALPADLSPARELRDALRQLLHTAGDVNFLRTDRRARAAAEAALRLPALRQGFDRHDRVRGRHNAKLVQNTQHLRNVNFLRAAVAAVAAGRARDGGLEALRDLQQQRLLFGTEDSVNTRYPRDIVLSTGFDTIDGLDDGNIEKVAAGVDSLAASHKANASKFASYRSVVTVGTISDGGKLIAGGTGVTIGSNSNAYTCFDVVPIEDYNAVMGTNETLAPDEVIVYGYRMKYKYDTVTLGDGKTYKVKKTVDSFLIDGDSAVNIASSIYIFVPDFKSAATDFAKPENHNGVRTVNYKYFRFFDTELDTAGERALCNDYIDATKPVMSSYGNMMTFSIDSRNAGRDDYYSAFGSLFYLGVMLSVVFIFAAVLIIYYKQVSEGYEDQSRFEIMQKVGMTKKEIRKSINSQLLTVFFLPLAGAGLHMIFASIIIRRILLAFNFNNPVLFAVTTLVCFVVFALFYTLIYRVTSNAYYKIVSGAKERE